MTLNSFIHISCSFWNGQSSGPGHEKFKASFRMRGRQREFRAWEKKQAQYCRQVRKQLLLTKLLWSNTLSQMVATHSRLTKKDPTGLFCPTWYKFCYVNQSDETLCATYKNARQLIFLTFLLISALPKAERDITKHTLLPPKKKKVALILVVSPCCCNVRYRKCVQVRNYTFSYSISIYLEWGRDLLGVGKN